MSDDLHFAILAPVPLPHLKSGLRRRYRHGGAGGSGRGVAAARDFSAGGMTAAAVRSLIDDGRPGLVAPGGDRDSRIWWHRRALTAIHTRAVSGPAPKEARRFGTSFRPGPYFPRLIPERLTFFRSASQLVRRPCEWEIGDAV